MKTIQHLSQCPSCQSDLHVRRLQCDECGLALEGQFPRDPLFQLSADDLHFVRLFLHCEGSIRDMEKALGISYPTVKARLANVKNRLSSSSEVAAAPATSTANKTGTSILDQLESGEVDFDTALAAIKKKGKNNAK